MGKCGNDVVGTQSKEGQTAVGNGKMWKYENVGNDVVGTWRKEGQTASG
jgi:hypothetical protein